MDSGYLHVLIASTAFLVYISLVAQAMMIIVRQECMTDIRYNSTRGT
jgi:hypothetical protein